MANRLLPLTPVNEPLPRTPSPKSPLPSLRRPSGGPAYDIDGGSFSNSIPEGEELNQDLPEDTDEPAIAPPFLGVLPGIDESQPRHLPRVGQSRFHHPQFVEDRNMTMDSVNSLYSDMYSEAGDSEVARRSHNRHHSRQQGREQTMTLDSVASSMVSYEPTESEITPLPRKGRVSQNKVDVKMKGHWRRQLTDAFAKKKEFTFDEMVMIKKTAREKETSNTTVFMPGSVGLTAWRTIVTIAVLWAVCVTPVELAFSWWAPPAFFGVASRFVDAACILDMVVNFNAARLDHGRVVYDRMLIAKGYLKSWFIIDILTNIPWDFMFASGKSRAVVKILKLPKLFRVVRLLRVAQEEAYYFGSLFSLGIILFLSHYISCLWAWILVQCDTDIDAVDAPGDYCPTIAEVYFEGLSVGMATIGGSDGWLRFIAEHIELGSGTVRMTSGGHIWKRPPDAWAEFAATCTSLAGFLAIAMLFANVAHTIGKTGAHAMAFNERLSNLKAAAAQHSIPHELFSRIKKHFHYVWSCGSDASRALLRDMALTADLRRELALCFYGGSLRQVPFLADSDEGFLRQLCERVEMECFSPGDRIIAAGEVGTELYFLVVGRMRIVLPDNVTVLKSLHEGSFFGEMGLLFPGTARTVSVIAETFGWVLIIDRVALEEICTEELLDTFRAVARERFERNAGIGIRPVPALTRAGSQESMKPTIHGPLVQRAPVRGVLDRRKSEGGVLSKPMDLQPVAAPAPVLNAPANGTLAGPPPSTRPRPQAWVPSRTRRSSSFSRVRLHRSKDDCSPGLHHLEAAAMQLGMDMRELGRDTKAALSEIRDRLHRVEERLAEVAREREAEREREEPPSSSVSASPSAVSMRSVDASQLPAANRGAMRSWTDYGPSGPPEVAAARTAERGRDNRAWTMPPLQAEPAFQEFQIAIQTSDGQATAGWADNIESASDVTPAHSETLC